MANATCSSCGRRILWAASPSGRMLPLDARPMLPYSLNSSGPNAVVPLAVRVALTDPVYVSHFTTCPSATQHSRCATTKRSR